MFEKKKQKKNKKRMNWISFQVKSGLISLSQLILGANSLVQSCIPDLFQKTDEKYYQEVLQQLEVNY